MRNYYLARLNKGNPRSIKRKRDSEAYSTYQRGLSCPFGLHDDDIMSQNYNMAMLCNLRGYERMCSRAYFLNAFQLNKLNLSCHF